MSDTDPTKPTPNDEKFKPHNVKGPLKAQAPDQLRGAPGDTEGYDVSHGSQPTPKSTPNA